MKKRFVWLVFTFFIWFKESYLENMEEQNEDTKHQSSPKTTNNHITEINYPSKYFDAYLLSLIIMPKHACHEELMNDSNSTIVFVELSSNGILLW